MPLSRFRRSLLFFVWMGAFLALGLGLPERLNAAPKAKAKAAKAPAEKKAKAKAKTSAPPEVREKGPAYALADCLRLAVQQNPDVLVAAKRLEGAKGTLMESRAGLFPTLGSAGYYQRRQEQLATQGGVDLLRKPDDYYLSARLTQNVYSAQATRNRVAIGKTQFQGEELNYLTALDAAGLEVRTAFYQTLFAEANIGVRQQAVEILGAQLKDQRDRLAAGSVSQLNVNRAQVALANEQPSLDEARYQLRAAYVALAEVLGIPYADDAMSAPFRVRGSLEYRGENLSLDQCLRRAEELRPEIQARKLDIETLNRQITVEKAATRPRVDVFAGYDLYSETNLLSARDNFSGYTVGVNGSWAIFDGFATLGRVRSARARVGGAAATLGATRLQVQGEVRTAYYQLQQAEATLRPQSENIRLANETLQIARTNFDVGLATQLDILQSRVDLTRAQTNELAARLSCNLARARLDRAMGTNRPGMNAADAPAPK
jgi:outer membrane protein